jgi:hypothetical protein
VSDIAADGSPTLLYSSPTGAAAPTMPGVPPVHADVPLLGRTLRLLVSPSAALASATTRALLMRTAGFIVPSIVCAASCIVLVAVFVRRHRREAREGKSFEAYVGYVLHELR